MGTETLWLVFVQYLLPVLGTAAGAALTWALTRLGRWLSTKTTNEKLAGLMVQMTDSVAVSVKHVEQTLRPLVTKVSADGKITPDEARELRNAAITAVKAEMGARLNQLGLMLGLSPEDVSGMIERRVEATVAGIHP